MAAFQFKLGDNETGEGLTRVFNMIDKDGNGVIELHDLKRVAKEVGENMSDEALMELI